MKARQRQGSAEQALATAKQRIKSSAARDDETREQEGPESWKKRIVAGLPVCFLLFHVNKTHVSCVTTLEVDVATVDEYTACEQLTQLI